MKKLLITLFLSAAAFLTAAAQEFRTGYFLDSYAYGYRINPAAPIEGKPYTFVGLGIGNVTAEAHTNLSVMSFLKPSMEADGTMSLLLPLFDSSFSLSEALAGFSSNNDVFANANVNLITFGRQGENNRFSVELNTRADLYAGLPLDLFKLVKRGVESLAADDWNGDYSFAGVHFDANAYTELAFGYTQAFGDFLTVGGRIKGLVGLGAASFDLDASLCPGTTHDIKGVVDGSIRMSSPMLIPLPTYQSGGKTYYSTDWSTLDSQSIFSGNKSITGWGLGFDLGVTLQPVDGLYISAAANDLGFINWAGNLCGEWRFDGEVDGEDYKDIFSVENTSGKRYTKALNYSFNAGVKYRMPFYDRLSVGFLGTIQKHYKEARLGVDVTPADFISIAASGAYGSQGFNFGAALSLKFPIINFFIGTDAMIFQFTPQMIPLSKINTVVTAGLLLAI